MSELDLPSWTKSKGDIYQKDLTRYIRMIASDRGFWSVMVAFEEGAKTMGEGKEGGKRSFEGHLARAKKAAEKWAKDFDKKNGGKWREAT